MKILKTLALCLPLFFTAPAMATDTTNAADTQNDAMVLSFIATVDKNEVAAATLALSKNPPKEIKDYANYLKKEHTKNLAEAQKLFSKLKVSPVDTSDVQNLQQQGQADAQKLSDLSGANFNNAYIEAMIQGHTDVLAAINDKLLPSVTDKKLKKFVLDTRKHVEMHLKKAQAIQKQLAKINGTNTTTPDTTS